MEVYLDNSATTKPRDEVIHSMIHMLKENYGNPSSLHRKGLIAEKEVRKVREIISDFLNARTDEIFFTSGGTESNNIAIQGIIEKYSKRGNHIITTKIEHSSVLNIFKKYEKKGFNITYLDVDRNGLIDLNELKNCLNLETILVAIMMVNNEIGTIQPIQEIKKIVKEKNKNIKIHVDAVQAFGKIDLDIKALGIDTLSFSGHKIHGPKGIGGLFVKKDVILESIIYGGNQERGIRSGTENVPGIVGLGKAVEILSQDISIEREKILQVKNYFINKLNEKLSKIKINSFVDERCAPHIVNISFIGVRGEVLLHYLEEQEIYISTGSACSSRSKGKSYVLQAIGLSNKEIDGTVRFSFSYENSISQIDYAIDKLIDSVNEIRKIIMR